MFGCQGPKMKQLDYLLCLYTCVCVRVCARMCLCMHEYTCTCVRWPTESAIDSVGHRMFVCACTVCLCTHDTHTHTYLLPSSLIRLAGGGAPSSSLELSPSLMSGIECEL